MLCDDRPRVPETVDFRGTPDATMADVIVDCAVYRDGKRETVTGDLSEALDAARDQPDAFVWIGVHDPTDHEFAHIVDEFGVHPLAAEDAVKAHQRPKLDTYERSLFLVIKPVVYVRSHKRLDVGEVMVLVGDRFVMTVRHGPGTALRDVRRDLEADVERLKLGPMAVMHAVADRIVDGYGPVLAALEEDIDALEERIFAGARVDSTRRIYELKREVISFRRAVRPLVDALTRLAESHTLEVPDEIRPFFRDVADHVVRTAETVEGYDDLLTSVLGANAAQVTVRQNDDMRRISAWVAIAAVPTMVAGIYGMNFENMPELRWRYGYFVVLGFLVVACGSLYRAFRRSGWL
jgi:magnesium transporter